MVRDIETGIGTIHVWLNEINGTITATVMEQPPSFCTVNRIPVTFYVDLEAEVSKPLVNPDSWRCRYVSVTRRD